MFKFVEQVMDFHVEVLLSWALLNQLQVQKWYGSVVRWNGGIPENVCSIFATLALVEAREDIGGLIAP